MNQNQTRKYCHNCEKIFYDDTDNNFCSLHCQQKYNLDKEKWNKLKQEKEDEKLANG